MHNYLVFTDNINLGSSAVLLNQHESRDVKAAVGSSKKTEDLTWKFEQAHLPGPFPLLSAALPPYLHCFSPKLASDVWEEGVSSE